ncbi:MAG: ABC transporter substrate-binding protein [Pseudomonadota bacterium]
MKVPLLSLLCLITSVATAAPQRVLSLNLCTDQLLMVLLPPQRIVSITWLSRTEGDPALLKLAQQLPVNHGSPEEVLAARPDLVLAGKYTTASTRALLQQVGIPVLEVDSAADWEGIRRITLQVAAALGAQSKARELLADMDADLAQLAHERPVQPIRVIGWGGSAEDVPGRDTLFNTILESAGGVNLAALDNGARSFDLEQVLLADPQVVMRGAAYSGKPSLRNSVATHPVLREKLGAHMIAYPEAVYGCGVPRASQLARELATTLRSASGP